MFSKIWYNKNNMKIISWNLNGIRAAFKKGLLEFIKSQNADFFCFQEVRAKIEEIPAEIKNLKNYYQFWHPAKKGGWSGVGILAKTKPLKVIYKINDEKIDQEGRIIILEFAKFYLVNVYFVQAGRELIKLPDKLRFNKKFEKFCLKLKKPIIIAGDFNVAHTEIDLANPKENEGKAMFTKEERKWFDDFLKKGFIDAFRVFNREAGNYTWWTWRANARARNIGWRIDYFLISKNLKKDLKNCSILKNVFGSDHAPIRLEVF